MIQKDHIIMNVKLIEIKVLKKYQVKIVCMDLNQLIILILKMDLNQLIIEVNLHKINNFMTTKDSN